MIGLLRPYGCPPGIAPAQWRAALVERIERQSAILSALVDALDQMDADCDLEDNRDAEPWLGWCASGAMANTADLEMDDPGLADRVPVIELWGMPYDPDSGPHVAKLGVELDRLSSQTEQLWQACCAVPKGAEAGAQAAEAAHDAAWHARERAYEAIAELPAASVGDLRVKARALALMDDLMDGEVAENPSATDTKLIRQIVAGLSDERLV